MIRMQLPLRRGSQKRFFFFFFWFYTRVPFCGKSHPPSPTTKKRRNWSINGKEYGVLFTTAYIIIRIRRESVKERKCAKISARLIFFFQNNEHTHTHKTYNTKCKEILTLTRGLPMMEREKGEKGKKRNDKRREKWSTHSSHSSFFSLLHVSIRKHNCRRKYKKKERWVIEWGMGRGRKTNFLNFVFSFLHIVIYAPIHNTPLCHLFCNTTNPNQAGERKGKI